MGNLLVDDTKSFKERLQEFDVMQDPVNLQKFTNELLDCGFIDEDYFYGTKL